MSVSADHKRTAVLILSHVINKSVNCLLDDVWKDCSDEFTVRFLCDNTRGKFDPFRNDLRYTLFTVNQLADLGYPGKLRLQYTEAPKQRDGYHKDRNFVMGNSELALLSFYRNNPQFDYYWIVEYDVRYSGSWRQFFSHFAPSQSDLLGTSLMTHRESPSWSRWKSMDFEGKTIDQNDFIRGFFPIIRLSNRALRQLDADYRTGVSGHYECLIPTLLYQTGFSIEDIGGDGSFVKSGNTNRFYRSNRSSHSLAPGTFVFRPGFDRPGDQPDTLWHPVKYRPLWRIIASRIKRKLLD